MADQNSMNVRLAFVDVSVFEDGSIRGGVLVTDLETRPLEFRVTSPVKPTAMQRILYGKTLVEFVYGELIGLPLVKAVKEPLSLVITRNENLLVMRPGLSIPVVFISQDMNGIKSGSGDSEIRPLVYKEHRRYEGESAWAQSLLADLLQRHNPFEPFERLKTAMKEVHKQKIGERASHE